MRLDAADRRLAKRHLDARHMRSWRREDADQALARVGRTAHHLHDARACLDLADAKLVRVRVRLSLKHARDGKILELRRRVFDAFHLKSDEGQLCCDLVERSIGLQVVFQPGEREFHGRAKGQGVLVKARGNALSRSRRGSNSGGQP